MLIEMDEARLENCAATPDLTRAQAPVVAAPDDTEARTAASISGVMVADASEGARTAASAAALGATPRRARRERSRSRARERRLSTVPMAHPNRSATS